MKKVALCSLALLLSAVGSAKAGQSVSLCGTGDSQELLRSVGAAFEKANPGISVEVPDGIGNDGGIKAAAARKCDFGRVSRTLTGREKDLKLTYRVFAFLPVVFVVDPAAGIENLSSRQIVGIFSGKVVAWSEVGGTGGAIAVVNRGANNLSRGEVNKRIKGFKEIANPVGATASTIPEAVALLSKTPSAIGYLPASAAKGLKLKVVKVDGVAPTAASVVPGIYPLAAPFGLVWKGEFTPEAKRFFHFLKDSEGRKIIKSYGAIPADLL